MGMRPFLTWTIEAWERAARSLWVDCVAKTVGPFGSFAPSLMANRSRYSGLNLAYPYQASSKWMLSTLFPEKVLNPGCVIAETVVG